MSQGSGETGDGWRHEVDAAVTAAHDLTNTQRPPLTNQNAGDAISDIFATEIMPPINAALRSMATTLIRFAAPRITGRDTDGNMPHYPFYRELSTGMLVVGEPDERNNLNSVAHGISVNLYRTAAGLKEKVAQPEALAKLCDGTESPLRPAVTQATGLLRELLSRKGYKLEVVSYLIGNRPELLADRSGVYRRLEALPHLTRSQRWSKLVDRRAEAGVDRQLEEHGRGVFASRPEVDCWAAPLPLFTDPSDRDKRLGYLPFTLPQQPYYSTYDSNEEAVEDKVDRLLEPARIHVANAVRLTQILGEVGSPLREFRELAVSAQ